MQHILTFNFDVLSPFIRYRLAGNMDNTLIIIIGRSWVIKNTHIILPKKKKRHPPYQRVITTAISIQENDTQLLQEEEDSEDCFYSSKGERIFSELNIVDIYATILKIIKLNKIKNTDRNIIIVE